MTEHGLEVSVQANAYEVRVMPEPKQAASARSDGMTEHGLEVSVQANAYAVRVMPEPKRAASARSDGMTEPEPKQAAMRGRTV